MDVITHGKPLIGTCGTPPPVLPHVAGVRTRDSGREGAADAEL